MEISRTSETDRDCERCKNTNIYGLFSDIHFFYQTSRFDKILLCGFRMVTVPFRDANFEGKIRENHVSGKRPPEFFIEAHTLAPMT